MLRTENHPAHAGRGMGCLTALLLMFVCLGWAGADAADTPGLQFDVFAGYDGIVPQAAWVPFLFEVKNDGPTFTGTVELGGAALDRGQSRRLVVELPTGTLKRFVIPVFANPRSYSQWDIRLYDERGKMRAEQTGIRPRKMVAPGIPILGAIPRTAGGTPQFQAILPQQNDLQPMAARLLPSILPDNPLVLDGLNCIYLNSERAADLTLPQVNALMSWVSAGGNLILAIEQPGDVTGSPWLKNIVPCEIKDLRPLKEHPELHEYLRSTFWKTNSSFQAARNYPGASPRRSQGPQASETLTSPDSPFANLADDMKFEAAEMQTVVAKVRDGRVELASGEVPLIVTADRGRGRITCLLFSPEREPVRSWRNLPVFWAKLAEVPGNLYASSDFNRPGGWSSDGIFGAMLDSRQVHKLPIEWLLLLLLCYLIVIGPLDQYWLKKIRRPMLTWITFPCYVVAFSLVIYLIGYKLRAGESEMNELHVIDVLAQGDRAELRGRSYASIYAPANQRYRVIANQKYAAFRSAFSGMYGGSQSGGKTEVVQEGDSFKADIFVPVWTSQLFVNDWAMASSPAPLAATVSGTASGWRVRLENHTDTKLTSSQLVIGEWLIPLGEVPANDAKTFNVSAERGKNLRQFVLDHGRRFQTAVQSRQYAFGSSSRGWIDDLPNSSVAASFISEFTDGNYGGGFQVPPGLDLTTVVDRGNAVVLAWADGYAPGKSIYQFSPRRGHRYTLWRYTLPVGKS
jgi:hypothetical protein